MRSFQVVLLVIYTAALVAAPGGDLVLCRETGTGEHHVESRHAVCVKASSEGDRFDSSSPNLMALVGRSPCVDLTVVFAAHPARDPRHAASLPMSAALIHSPINLPLHPVAGHQARHILPEFLHPALVSLLSSTILII